MPERVSRQLQNRKREQIRREEGSTFERVSRQLKNREKETTQQRQSRIDAVRSRLAAVRVSIGRNLQLITITHHWITAQILSAS